MWIRVRSVLHQTDKERCSALPRICAPSHTHTWPLPPHTHALILLPSSLLQHWSHVAVEFQLMAWNTSSSILDCLCMWWSGHGYSPNSPDIVLYCGTLSLNNYVILHVTWFYNGQHKLISSLLELRGAKFPHFLSLSISASRNVVRCEGHNVSVCSVCVLEQSSCYLSVWWWHWLPQREAKWLVCSSNCMCFCFSLFYCAL